MRESEITFKVGDLVSEKYHEDWLGVVLKVSPRGPQHTKYPIQEVLVSWIDNPNSMKKEESLSSIYLSLVKRGNDE